MKFLDFFRLKFSWIISQKVSLSYNLLVNWGLCVRWCLPENPLQMASDTTLNHAVTFPFCLVSNPRTNVCSYLSYNCS